MKALRELDIPNEDLTWTRLLERQATRNGQKPYLIFEGNSWSYVDVEKITRQLAVGLISFGIQPGDHVALLVGNCPETLFLNFALGRIGAVSCPINTAAKGELLAYFLSSSNSCAIILGTDSFSKFEEIESKLPKVQRVLVVQEKQISQESQKLTQPGYQGISNKVINYENLIKSNLNSLLPKVGPKDPQAIMFTSGTTGPSKGIVVTHEQSFGFSIGRVEYLGLESDDVVYTCLPLFHGNALNAAAVPAFLADATLILSRRFSARSFWEEVRKNNVTQFNLLSSMTNILWGMSPSPQDRVHKVRQCTMVPVPIFAADFTLRFGIEIVSSYSLTDFGQGTFLQPSAPKEKYRSAGQPRPRVELTIIDDNEQPLPNGEAGEICLRSIDPTLSGRYYYGMPEETALANQGGWFHTGDRGYLDKDGFLYFVDRKKDAIRRRGENISSWEVEQVIARHPDVADVAVYAVSSEFSEDEVMASIVCRDGRTIAPVDLILFCESNMAYFMVPRYLEFLPDLPRTLTEKVQKQDLRKRAESRIESLWDREKSGIVLKR